LSQLGGRISLGVLTLDIHFMILGATLSLVGTSAASLGLVIGATMPTGRVRHLPSLRRAHQWYTFDAAAALSGIVLLVGLAVDGFVLAYWVYYRRPAFSLFYTRLTLLGLLLIGMAVQIAFSALLLGASFTGTGRMRRRTDNVEHTETVGG
jgi:hypothetical protein